jgi:MFS family permease
LQVAPSSYQMSNVTKDPWRFVLPLLLGRFALGMSWAVIHPYIAEQVTSFGIPASGLGFWVGAIESSLQLAEGFTCPAFVYLSGYTGRKPVFLCCMLAYSWCLLPIGLSKTLGALLFWRTAQGMFTAYSPITKGIVAEVCDDSNRSQGSVSVNISTLATSSWLRAPLQTFSFRYSDILFRDRIHYRGQLCSFPVSSCANVDRYVMCIKPWVGGSTSPGSMRSQTSSGSRTTLTCHRA